jgi:hypothetical protein
LVASVIAVVQGEPHIALMRILVAFDIVDNITLAEQELRDARQIALCLPTNRRVEVGYQQVPRHN